MKTQHVIAAIVGLALPLLTGQAQAAEIKVLASTAVKTSLEELGPQFEKATGNKVDFAFAPAAICEIIAGITARADCLGPYTLKGRAMITGS